MRFYLVSEQFLEEIKERKLEQTAFGLIDRIYKESPLIQGNSDPLDFPEVQHVTGKKLKVIKNMSSIDKLIVK